MKKAAKTSSQLKKNSFSRYNFIAFAFVFAAIGGLILYKSLAAPNPNLLGDLNNDNQVSLSDLTVMLANINTSFAVADINGDSRVDVVDLSILMSHYGQSYTPPSSGPTTRLAWFYGEPNDGTTVQTLASRNIFFVESGHQVEDGYLNSLRQNGVTSSIPGYIEFPRTMGPIAAQSSCPASYSGFTTSWSSWDGDFCSLINPHEDWFLHNSSGARIYDDASPNAWYYMNVSSAGWRAYMADKVNRYFTEFPGLNGIFLDDTFAAAGTPRNAGCADSVCATDAAWHAAVMADLQAIKAGLPAGKKLWINSDDTAHSGYASTVDGFIIENLGSGWSDGAWMSQSEVEQRLTDVDAQLSAGGDTVLVGQGNTKNSIQQMKYSHALYLMVANSHVSYRFQNAGDYLSFWDYPEYQFDLGTATGSRFKVNGSTFERDFTAGEALANMGNANTTVNLTRAYLMPDGTHTGSTITLAGHSGVALRFCSTCTPPPPPPPPTPTLVFQTGSYTGTDGQSYTTPTFNSLTGDSMIVFAVARGSSALNPTLTDAQSHSWTLLSTAQFNNDSRIYAFVAGSAANSNNNTLTLNLGAGQVGTDFELLIYDVQNAKYFGPSSILQIAKQENSPGSSAPAPTFTNPVASGDGVAETLSVNVNWLLGPITGWSNDYGNAIDTPIGETYSNSISGGFTGRTPPWSGGPGNGSNFGIISLEVKLP